MNDIAATVAVNIKGLPHATARLLNEIVVKHIIQRSFARADGTYAYVIGHHAYVAIGQTQCDLGGISLEQRFGKGEKVARGRHPRRRPVLCARGSKYYSTDFVKLGGLKPLVAILWGEEHLNDDLRYESLLSEVEASAQRFYADWAPTRLHLANATISGRAPHLTGKSKRVYKN